ncbi:hypothetical protein ANN_09787 [Periplaneta americana]|uniref:Uncharacterized protein n=1 Tax=Periplaneta americana TaxID=6978 RepID=A0ABQ8TMM0_PERAM|nr:hypothetical protein ANN_09787 [Periplaneta americana]
MTDLCQGGNEPPGSLKGIIINRRRKEEPRPSSGEHLAAGRIIGKKQHHNSSGRAYCLVDNGAQRANHLARRRGLGATLKIRNVP